jgi:hypothetical protein
MSFADKESAFAQQIELSRFEMERDWQLRQENVLPLETAWNEGRFYGRVLKGLQPLTTFQRVGVLLIAVQAIGGSLILMFVNGRRLADIAPIWMPVLLLSLVLGVRFCWVALRQQPRSFGISSNSENQ